MTALIRLDGDIVATVGATKAFLVPAIEALDSDDTRRRTIELMCQYALMAEDEGLPYDDERALHFARRRLAG